MQRDITLLTHLSYISISIKPPILDMLAGDLVQFGTKPSADNNTIALLFMVTNRTGLKSDSRIYHGV